MVYHMLSARSPGIHLPRVLICPVPRMTSTEVVRLPSQNNTTRWEILHAGNFITLYVPNLDHTSFTGVKPLIGHSCLSNRALFVCVEKGGKMRRSASA